MRLVSLLRTIVRGGGVQVLKKQPWSIALNTDLKPERTSSITVAIRLIRIGRG